MSADFDLLRQRAAPDLAEAMSSWTIEWIEQVGSSNVLLADRAAAGIAIDQCVMIVDEQTAGRGRLGRRWTAPAGAALQMSFGRQAGDDNNDIAEGLAWRIALAIAEALDTLPGLHGAIQLKWPNDLYLNDRKVGGVLVESRVRGGRIDALVVGIGINVGAAPAAHALDRQQAVGALAEAGDRINRCAVLCAVAPAVAGVLAAPPTAAEITSQVVRYNQRLRWHKQMLETTPDIGKGGGVIRGRCEGIAIDGALQVSTANGTIRITDSQTRLRACNATTS